jgi:large subunit ribosomal protein L4
MPARTQIKDKRLTRSKVSGRAIKDSNKKTTVSKSSSVKTVSKTEAVKSVSKPAGLNVPVYSLKGVKKGTVNLPKEIFGTKVNKTLLAQALRVYLVNQRQGTASSKTRGEVIGSTRKIYRQKGTGRARHGAIKAPIFVGGGIAHGPRPRNFELKLSKQMKKKALFSALSSKAGANQVAIVDVASASGKTKEISGMLKSIDPEKKKILFVADPKSNAVRGARNIEGVKVNNLESLNVYEVLDSNSLVITRESLDKFAEFFKGGTNQ